MPFKAYLKILLLFKLYLNIILLLLILLFKNIIIVLAVWNMYIICYPYIPMCMGMRVGIMIASVLIMCVMCGEGCVSVGIWYGVCG